MRLFVTFGSIIARSGLRGEAHYATANEWRLWPQYDNLRGYYGVDYPTQFHPSAPFAGAPMSPFFLMRGEKQGLYAGVRAPSSELVAWHTELRPGYGSSIDWSVSGGEGDRNDGKDGSAVHGRSPRLLLPLLLTLPHDPPAGWYEIEITPEDADSPAEQQVVLH